MIEQVRPNLVVWSSLWPIRPDLRIRFYLTDLPDRGADLRWTLLAEEPAPDPEFVRRVRHRIGELINASLRYTYGQ
ncbi:hypothetical protein ACWDUN_16925 [Mycobacterium sp. NPDC003323]